MKKGILSLILIASFAFGTANAVFKGIRAYPPNTQLNIGDEGDDVIVGGSTITMHTPVMNSTSTYLTIKDLELNNRMYFDDAPGMYLYATQYSGGYFEVAVDSTTNPTSSPSLSLYETNGAAASGMGIDFYSVRDGSGDSFYSDFNLLGDGSFRLRSFDETWAYKPFEIPGGINVGANASQFEGDVTFFATCDMTTINTDYIAASGADYITVQDYLALQQEPQLLYSYKSGDNYYLVIEVDEAQDNTAKSALWFYDRHGQNSGYQKILFYSSNFPTGNGRRRADLYQDMSSSGTFHISAQDEQNNYKTINIYGITVPAGQDFNATGNAYFDAGINTDNIYSNTASTITIHNNTEFQDGAIIYGLTMTNQIEMNGNEILNINHSLSNLIDSTGGSMSGNLDMNQNSIINALEFSNTGDQCTLGSTNDTTNIQGTSIEIQANTIITGTLDTGLGATEVYAMNQDIESTDAVIFATVDTGQGANELYDMDQNVLTNSTVLFSSMVVTNDITANAFHGDGSALSGISAAAGSAVLVATQTFTGINTFSTYTVMNGVLDIDALGKSQPILTLESDNDSVGESNDIIFKAVGGVNGAAIKERIDASGDHSLSFWTTTDDSTLVEHLTINDDGDITNNDQIIKGWVSFDGTGTLSVSDSYNVSSVVDNDTGSYTINWDIDFDNATYACVATATDLYDVRCQNHTTADVDIFCRLATDDSSADSAYISVIAIGTR